MEVSLSFIVGIIGNVISLLVFASPIRTFRLIVAKKSTGNYKSLPYISTLLCTTLWTFYGLLKPDGLLVITVNSAGTILQFIYVFLFIVFAPKIKKIRSSIAVAILNVGFTGVVVTVTLLALHGNLRITVVGVICAVLAIGMYASPLTAMKQVISTKSVEFMPFFLSLFLFLNAGVWCAYAFLVKDFFIGVPNAVGFVLGSAQLILYFVYKNKAKPIKSMDKIIDEDGSNHVVIELNKDIKSPKVEENKTTIDTKTLAHTKSLPNPNPKLTRPLSSVPGLLRTISSLGPYDINYGFARDKEGHVIEVVDKL